MLFAADIVRVDPQLVIVLILLGLAVVVLSALVRRAWESRGMPGAHAFIIINVLALGWAATTAFELASQALDAKLMWDDAEFLFIAFLPPSILVMVLDYAGRPKWLNLRNLFLLSLIPFLTVIFTWTNDLHLLMRSSAWLETSHTYPRLAWASGPWFIVHSAYSYTLSFVSLVVLVRTALTSLPAYRKGPLVLLAGLLVPMMWNLLDMIHPQVLPAADVTPVVFSVAGFIFAWGLFRAELFALVPAARHTLVEDMGDGFLVLDKKRRVVDANRAVREIMGQLHLDRPEGDLAGHLVAEVWEEWTQLEPSCGDKVEVALLTLAKGSDWRRYEVKVTPLLRHKRVAGHVLVFRDITERALLEESLRVQALSDTLTGLGNRAYLMDRLTTALRQAHRHPERSFALLILDLDHFKHVNDSVGHLAGDALLQHVAEQLIRCTREIDCVARLGGDEFMIILDGINSTADLLPILDRLQMEIALPVRFQRQELKTTASMGVVIWDPSYVDTEELLRAADIALYQAKEAGRACYRIFDEEMHRSVLLAARAESDLRAALEQKEFCVEYQPVVDAATRQAVALEAFVRWRDPRRGLVAAADFIDTAQETGLIIPLSKLVLEQVCQQISYWRTAKGLLGELPVSLNISSRQLLETDLAADTLGQVAKWRIPPDALILEITEQPLLASPARARQALAELRRLGMQVYLDDFGARFSSLHHLTSFPLDGIKLDRSLVARLPGSGVDLEFARALIHLTHAVGLSVTAEGVENAEQWRTLAALDCDCLQGYYLCPPAPPAQLPALLAQLVTPQKMAFPTAEQSEPLLGAPQTGAHQQRPRLRLVHRLP